MSTPATKTEGTDLLCVGSIVADLMLTNIAALPQVGKLTLADHMEIHTGGCATNTSLAFAKLGGKVKLVGRVGKDAIGESILHEINRTGVITDSVLATQQATAVTVVLVSPNGERTFIYYPGANSSLSSNDVDPRDLFATKIIHFADTFLLPDLDGVGTLSLLREAKTKGVTTSLDTSWDTKGRWLSLLQTYFPFVDFFFCSLAEAQAMTGHINAQDAAQVLLNSGPGLVIIKMGENGSLIRSTDFSLHIPAISAAVVDTTGAGDCYVAAFLFGYLQGWDYDKIGMFASAAGSACIGAIGATTGIRSYRQMLSLMRRVDE
jgi:sugar/nucleoside kinase (ribokinase family)